MEPAVRLRLLFDGGDNILSEAQRREGLRKSWMLLKPQHKSVADVVSDLIGAFCLRDSCTGGLVLSMDGFVLPPFESTTIFRDKDLICVKRRGDKVSRTIDAIEGAKTCEEEDVLEKPPLASVMMLLANEEFEKGTGGYQSEPEEDEDEEDSDMLLVDSTPNVDPASKKRKASKNSESSKVKRQRMITNRSVENTVKDKQVKCVQHVDGVSKETKSATPNSKSVHEDDDGKAISTPCDVPAGNKKTSRSSRRKKIQRVRRREMKIAENGKLPGRVMPTKDLRTDIAAEKDSVIDRSSEPEKVSLPVKGATANSGLAGDLNGNTVEQPQTDPESDAEGEIEPIVVRPGHIRFTPYGKDKDVQKIQDEKGALLLNGITNKRKGQKWGMERQSVPQRYQQKIFNGDYSNRKTKEKRPVGGQVDFEKLIPLIDSPKQGDVIAYRLLELSSSFCPELSSFRVGKIMWFNPESNRIMLVSVPEYPLQLEKKTGEGDSEESGLPFETSHYKDDGSLEIDFNSLVSVRIMKRGNGSQSAASPTVVQQTSAANSQPSTSGVTSRGVETTVYDKVFWASGTPPTCDKKEISSQAVGNGDFNPWEELSQALDDKKADLQEDGKWNKKSNGNSEKRSWSYRTSQRSALGPTLNRLREQNGI